MSSSELLANLNNKKLIVENCDNSSSEDEEYVYIPARKPSPQKKSPKFRNQSFSQEQSPVGNQTAPEQVIFEEESVVLMQEEHYGSIGLDLNMSGDQQIRFDGYGCVRINSRSPSKSRAMRLAENQHVSDFVVANHETRPVGARILSPGPKTQFTNTTKIESLQSPSYQSFAKNLTSNHRQISPSSLGQLKHSKDNPTKKEIRRLTKPEIIRKERNGFMQQIQTLKNQAAKTIQDKFREFLRLKKIRTASKPQNHRESGTQFDQVAEEESDDEEARFLAFYKV